MVKDKDKVADSPDGAEGPEAGETPAWVEEDPFPPLSSTGEAPEAHRGAGGRGPTASGRASTVVVDPSLSPEVAGSRKRVVPASRPVGSGRRSPPVEDETTDPGFGPRRRRIWGLPVYGWLLVAVSLVGALLLVFDLRNRNRYLLVCGTSKVELHQGRTFPWPFGHEVVGGPEFKPIAIPAEADCRNRVYQSREEAELGFLDYILGQARTALANPGAVNLQDARTQVLQAMLLTRAHRTRRKETQTLLAELAYREGRSGLARVENEIRTALSRFQEAQKLDGERFEDLADWIEHLESLLRSVAPSPSSPLAAPPGGPASALPPGYQPTPLPPTPGLSPGSPASRPAGPEPVESTDGGSPSSGGGILM